MSFDFDALLPTAAPPALTSPVALAALLLALPLFLWLYTALVGPSTFPALRGARILLLTAHPDDEAMFFSPTLLALSQPALANRIKILCLSAGDADGLGHIRQQELADSAALLGIDPEKDVVCLDVPELRDGMKESWDPRIIADLLEHTFVPSSQPPPPPSSQATSTPPSSTKVKRTKSASSSGTSASGGSSSSSAKRRAAASSSTSRTKTSSSASTISSSSTSTTSTSAKRAAALASSPPAPSAPSPPNLDVILTFDPHGVSRHPNHTACHAGALRFVSSLPQPSTVHMYTLTSVSILRKYLSFYDVPLSVLLGLGKILTRRRRRKGEPKRKEFPSWLLFVSGFTNFRTARRAMTNAHKSQMVWFRWGWISAGRYMIVNDLRRVEV